MSIFVKLGPKAGHGQFWCPVTQTQVKAGQVVEITKQSWLIKGAIEGGGLVIVDDPAKSKSINQMSKKELTAHVLPRFEADAAKQKFEDLTKAEMLSVAINFEEFDTMMASITDTTAEALEELAKAELDDEDFEKFQAADDQVGYLTKELPEYFDPFED